MKKLLEELQPASVFRHFENIAQIPHGSGNTKAIADYCRKIARQAGCPVVKDQLNNLIITIPATPGFEKAPIVIIQGHLDMVCAKTADSIHNFTTDSLQLKIESDWISANQTTLGGDDGVAVAMILALTEEKNLPHGKLYGVLTSDEEIGMLGAAALDCTSLSDASFMINIDSEKENEMVAGCAGGLQLNAAYPLHYTKAKGLTTRLTLSGLDGGHSGEMIDEYGFNANVLLGEVLSQLDQWLNPGIITLNGGTQNNVIPQSAWAEILIGENQKESFLKAIDELEKELQKSSGRKDKNLKLRADFGEIKESLVLGRDSKSLVLFILSNTPNGVQSIGRIIEGQPDTSLNLGIMSIKDKKLELCYLLRSNQIVTRTGLTEKLTAFTEYLGGTVSVTGTYPPWEFRKNSRLRDVFLAQYANLFNNEPKITSIHAGLECGIFSEKLPHIDIISIGPDILDIHTPQERLSISSTERIWKVLCAVLKAFH